MKFHIICKPNKAIRDRLDAIHRAVLGQGAEMSAAVDRMRTEVSELKTVVGSAKSLLESISQQLRDLKDDPAAIEALADELDATSNDLAAAVEANTPTS